MMNEQQKAELDGLEKEAVSGDFVPSGEPIGGGEEKPRVEVGEMLTGVCVVAFNILSARRGEHWKLKPEEAVALGGALGDVVNEYFPDVSMGPLPVLGGIAGMIIIPRVMLDQKAEAEEVGGEGGSQPEHGAS